MAHQSLYRRYRPQRFAEVRGQDHLVAALRNAVREGRVGHAYLFSGPRGTGKTTTARIIAKAMNCPDVVDGEPCGTCESCRAIEEGTSFDVHELDAASNNGVDAIRELVNHAALGTPGRTKVYILDEVHMLSTAASNALLKTLEEPPPHVVFVLATTDPQKVLPTIRSRCQHFEVHLIPADVLEVLVREIGADAGLPLTDEMVDYAVRHGGGSARDTLSIVDQVVAAGSVPSEDADALDELVAALAASDTRRALLAVETALSAGRSPRLLGDSLISRLRDVFLAAMGVSLDRLPDLERARVDAQAVSLGAARAARAIETIGEAFVGIADAPDQRIPLEVALVRLTRPEADTSVAALAERLERLERAMAGRAALPVVDAGAPGPAAPATVSPPPDAPTPAPPAPGPPAPGPPPPSPAEVSSIHPTAEPLAAPADGRGGRPADAARAALQRARGDDPATGAASRRRAPSRGPASSPPAAPAPVASPAPAIAPTASPAPAIAPTASPAAGGASASLDLGRVLGGWDDVLAALKPKARSLFVSGRVLRVVGDTVTVGLPNEPHRDRCRALATDVEAIAATVLGGVVHLDLVVDDGSAVEPPAPAPVDGPPPAGPGPTGPAPSPLPTSAGEPSPSPEPSPAEPSPAEPSPPAPPSPAARVAELRPAAAPAEPLPPVPAAPVPSVPLAPVLADDDEEAIDPDELVDATDAATSQTELVLQLFPGAEVVPLDDPVP